MRTHYAREILQGGEYMLKAGLMLGFGAGVLTAVVATSKMKNTIMDQGKKMLKDKIIKVLD